MITTPCGLAAPETDVLRLHDEFGYLIVTARADVGRTGDVVILDTLVVSADYKNVENRVLFGTDHWLAWHDEHCDCRSPNSI